MKEKELWQACLLAAITGLLANALSSAKITTIVSEAAAVATEATAKAKELGKV